MIKRLVVMAAAGLVAWTAAGQGVAVKTNALADALLNVNIGVEAGLAPRWTLDVGGQLNAWSLGGGRRWKHWMVQPEARYWLCGRFAGHFVAVHAFTGQYNVAGIGRDFKFLGTDCGAPLRNRYQGWAVGAGVGYGYALPLGRHWNLEAELGVGYAYMTYDRFACTGCGRPTGGGTHDYFGPTKAAVNLVYVF